MHLKPGGSRFNNTILKWLLCGFVFFFIPTSFADTLTILAGKDATLYEPKSIGDDDTANGSGQYLFAGNTKDQVARRATLFFDIAGSVPAAANIDSVQLHLYASQPENQTNQTINLHRLTSDWGEGASNAPDEEGKGTEPLANDATWNHTFFPGSFWSVAGGDYDATLSASVVVADRGSYSLGSSANMVADVQQWLDQPATNFGWLLIGNEAGEKTAKRFNSRENTTSSGTLRPALEINYTPVAPTGSCCTGASCQLVTEVECVLLGGSFGGIGSSCSPNPCAEAIGACCASIGTCTETTQAACEAGEGIFQFDESTCALTQCPVTLTPWLDALPLPKTATPISGIAGGAADYDISIVEFTQQLHSELPATTVWGYDDGTGASYPGPTIEASTNEKVTVNWINDLRDAETTVPRTAHILEVDINCVHGAENLPKTVVHLHGGHVAAAFDGYPENTFLPGEAELYHYPNGQQAAPLWYHDHALGITRLNVYMGLAGLYTIRDATEDALGLPAGDFEIPLVFQDRQFEPGGELYYPPVWQGHFFGDKALVNGKVWPYLEVTQGKYRFRLLNGSGSRIYTLSLSGGLDFTVIGNEGGLLTAPVAGLSSLTIGPGERYDVIVDFAGLAIEDEVLLTNSAPAPYPNGEVSLTQIMKFTVVAGVAHTDALPVSLRSVPPIDPADAVESRDFVLEKGDDDGCGRQNWLINGLSWDDITEYPELDTVETWRFINDTGVSHPMHMHLVFFQVLEREGFTLGAGGEIIPAGDPQPPAAHEAGWKDTVMVNPDEMVTVIARFEDYAGKYAYHCHILEHEDHEMMRQFQTIIPGCTVNGDDESVCDYIDNDCDGLVDEDYPGGGEACPLTCNTNIVAGVTETTEKSHEACEVLVLGPDFTAADGSVISASAGWEVDLMPGFSVQPGATLKVRVCGQSLCMPSTEPMPAGCHSCVDQICAADSNCCDTAYDQSCVDKVNTVCGLLCE